MEGYGVLTLCATPIGNLEDMTYRAVRVMKETDIIAAEDTRHTRKLLTHFDIHTHLESYHEHNKMVKGPVLIEKLKQGKNIVLVTDAGTPGISDPGEDIVKLALEAGIKVTAVPGAVAGIIGLIISGQNTRRFSFDGFLPQDKKERNTRLEALKKDTNTIILYEAPHRIKKTIGYLYEGLGNRSITITRELTKRYEEVAKMYLEEALSYFKERDPKGEYVLIIEGADQETLDQETAQSWQSITIEDHMAQYMNQGMAEKDAMRLVAKDRGLSKRDIYQQVKIKKTIS
ncbi:MAG TPA: 16S rRNA (cytidine(1402)-2'-O)-methyltransferase [Epulopiscium sp.]|nr:16S rRNA (cytidine(1402)-2'-O)-methyltransferase [Candidatus Epulonipiscium sp.]